MARRGYWLPPVRSPAKETAERRLDRGRNPRAARLRCGDGASALRAHVPLSTAPLSRTASALPICLAQTGEGGETGLPAEASCLRCLWRLQRKEPGWFVGEHMQERRVLAVPDGEETLTDLPGERAASLTRVGEAER